MGKEMVIKSSDNPAVTNENSIIVYDTSIKQTTHLFHGVLDIMEKMIELKPWEVSVNKIKFNVPDRSFDGEILGGLCLLQKIRCIS